MKEGVLVEVFLGVLIDTIIKKFLLTVLSNQARLYERRLVLFFKPSKHVQLLVNPQIKVGHFQVQRHFLSVPKLLSYNPVDSVITASFSF